LQTELEDSTPIRDLPSPEISSSSEEARVLSPSPHPTKDHVSQKTEAVEASEQGNRKDTGDIQTREGEMTIEMGTNVGPIPQETTEIHVRDEITKTETHTIEEDTSIEMTNPTETGNDLDPLWRMKMGTNALDISEDWISISILDNMDAQQERIGSRISENVHAEFCILQCRSTMLSCAI
jgi:hypothetical protein